MKKIKLTLSFIIITIVIALDQYTKHLAVTFLTSVDSVSILPCFDLILATNKGAAFSFLSNAGGWQQWLFGSIAVFISVILLIWIIRLPQEETWGRIALSLIMAGAIGNLWDRIQLGYVIDFIDLHLGTWHWPAFNVADSAITVGAILLILDLIKQHNQRA